MNIPKTAPLFVFLLALLAFPVFGNAAPRASTPNNQLTVAARVCSYYTDVRANRARNNIQESLRDLGKDSPYTAGSVLSAQVEEETNPDCKPLPNWSFKLGTGIAGSDVGAWGSLSKVSSPFTTQLVTKDSTPLLNEFGAPTGINLKAATTITLSDTEQALAAKGALWIQGGVPGDPVLTSKFKDKYGFAALRCSTDILNGDNVEFIAYPSGRRHVFCFAYYITPPPTAGEIVIKKQADSLPSGGTDPVSFRFGGNVSYEPNGAFTIKTKPGSTAAYDTFTRAVTGPTDEPWIVKELSTDGWALVSLSCSSRLGTSVTDISGSTASIKLASQDTVTCTYHNTASTPTALEVGKRSLGEVGSFPITITDSNGVVVTKTIKTLTPDVTEYEDTGVKTPGTYTIKEKTPASQYGKWIPEGYACDGVAKKLGKSSSFSVTLVAGKTPPRCHFINRFIPQGSITIRAVAWGAPTTKRFLVTSNDDPTFSAKQRAILSRIGVPATAFGQSTNPLPLGTYAIQEIAPVSNARGTWHLSDITCTANAFKKRAAGGAIVSLTTKTPHVTCAFTNTFTPNPPVTPPLKPDPEKPTSPPTDPDSGGVNPESPESQAPPTIDRGNILDGAGSDTTHPPSTGVVATGPEAVIPAVFREGSPWARLIEPNTDKEPSMSLQTSKHASSLRKRSTTVPLVTVSIPALKLTTHPLPLNVTNDGYLRVPGSERVSGWWTGGSLPGSRGLAVVAGHVDGPSGPGVFNRIRTLKKGDSVWVRRAGTKRIRYVINNVRYTPRSKSPASQLFSLPKSTSTHSRVLRLVTCGGRFNQHTGRYTSNVVVEAVSVS